MIYDHPEEVSDSYIASLFPSEPQHEYRHSKKRKVEEEMAMYERAVKDSLEPTFGRPVQALF